MFTTYTKIDTKIKYTSEVICAIQSDTLKYVFKISPRVLTVSG